MMSAGTSAFAVSNRASALAANSAVTFRCSAVPRILEAKKMSPTAARTRRFIYNLPPFSTSPRNILLRAGVSPRGPMMHPPAAARQQSRPTAEREPDLEFGDFTDAGAAPRDASSLVVVTYNIRYAVGSRLISGSLA